MRVAITVKGWTFRINKAGAVVGADKPNAKYIEHRVYNWADIGFSGGDIEEIRSTLERLNAVFPDSTLGVPVSDPEKKVIYDALEGA